MTDRPQPVVFDNAYDAMGDLYDMLPLLSPYAAVTTLDADYFATEAATRLDTNNVVELGIGTGRVAIPMALTGRHVFGVDLSTEMLTVTAQRAAAAGVSNLITPVQADFGAWELPDAQLADMVYCPYHSFSHIHHPDDRRQIIAHALDRLTPGGGVYLSLDDGKGTSGDGEVAFQTESGDDLHVEYTQVWDEARGIHRTTFIGDRTIAATGERQVRQFEIALAAIGDEELQAHADALNTKVTFTRPWADVCPEDRVVIFTKG